MGHLQAAQARHADIEKGDVRPQRLDHGQRGHAILGFAQHPQAGPQRQQLFAQGGAHMRFIVGQNGSAHVILSLK